MGAEIVLRAKRIRKLSSTGDIMGATEDSLSDADIFVCIRSIRQCSL